MEESFRTKVLKGKVSLYRFRQIYERLIKFCHLVKLLLIKSKGSSIFFELKLTY